MLLNGVAFRSGLFPEAKVAVLRLDLPGGIDLNQTEDFSVRATVSEATEVELKELLFQRPGAVLVDELSNIFAVVVRPSEFNLLAGMADLATNLDIYRARADDPKRGTLSFAEFTALNLKKRAEI